MWHEAQLAKKAKLRYGLIRDCATFISLGHHDHNYIQSHLLCIL